MTTQYLKKIKMKALEWPGNSSGLNPIENLWSIVKNSLRKQGLHYKNEANSVRHTHLVLRR